MKQIKKILFAGIVMLTAATASMGNTAPVADAGEDQIVSSASKVKLDGTGSYDVDKKDKLAYRWTFTRKPPGSAAEFSEVEEKKTKFSADVDGSYVIQLIVNDGTIDSAPDFVAVYVGSDTIAPVITLNGDNPMEVIQGDTFTDPGATAADDKDNVVDVTSTGEVDTSTVGTYTITYTAIDSAGNTAIETRTVNVVVGPPDAETSTLAASLTSIAADGIATSTVTVTVKDANSNPVTSAIVSLAQMGSSTISAVTKVGDGTYTFTVSSTTAETVTYTATADGTVVTQIADVTFTATPPAVTQLTPANGATNAGATNDLSMQFDQTISKTAGKHFKIFKTSGDIEHTNFDVNVQQVTVTGNTVTVNPNAHLVYGVAHYVQIDAGAFKSTVSSEDYAGIADKTTWNFTVSSGTGPCGCDELDNCDLDSSLQ